MQYNDLSFSHDGRHIAAAGSNGTVVVWSMATREVVKVLQPHEGSPVYAAKFLAPEKSVAPVSTAHQSLDSRANSTRCCRAWKSCS